jgi:uncharacterized protein
VHTAMVRVRQVRCRKAASQSAPASAVAVTLCLTYACSAGGRESSGTRSGRRLRLAVSVLGYVALDLRFEAVSEGVLVTGSAIAPLTGECARCLDPLTSTIEVSFQELYRYLPDPGEDENDVEERFLDGDYLDLEPAFRDAVVLALPLSPLCRDDCPGLCAECGARLAEVGPDHGHGDKVDPRWGLLAKLELHDRVED